jgi:hypothetical protein
MTRSLLSKRVRWVFAAGLLAFAAPGSTREGERWFSFVAYPAARPLCSEHVAGNAMHISWMSFASRDPVARVVAFYEKDLGTKADAQSPGELTLRARERSDDVITIYAADAAGTHPSCSAKPVKGEQTVILVSSATRAK